MAILTRRSFVARILRDGPLTTALIAVLGASAPAAAQPDSGATLGRGLTGPRGRCRRSSPNQLTWYTDADRRDRAGRGRGSGVTDHDSADGACNGRRRGRRQSVFGHVAAEADPYDPVGRFIVRKP
jgi:hypothetical protein